MSEGRRGIINKTGMRAIWFVAMFVFLCLFFVLMHGDKVYAAEILASEFEDENLYNFILDNYDTDGDGVLTTEEAETVDQIIINCNENIIDVALTGYIGSLKGLEYFTNLIFLQIDYNDESQPLDISALATMTQLQSVAIYGHRNIMDFMPLKGLTNLLGLSLDGSTVTDLSFLEDMPKLTHLVIGRNPSLTDGSPIANLKELTYISMNETGITDISFFSELENLEYINMQQTVITDFEPLRKSAGTLKHLIVGEYSEESAGYISKEDLAVISECVNLEWLRMDRMKITELPDMTGLTKLTELSIAYNYLSIEESVEKIPASIKSMENWMETIGLYKQRQKDGEDTLLGDGFASVELDNEMQVSVTGDFAQGTFLEALQIVDMGILTDYKDILSKKVNNIELIWLFDISTYKSEYIDGELQKEKSQPNSDAYVSMTLSINPDYEYHVFRQEENGAMTKLDSFLSGGVLQFTTDHFSIFSIVASQLFNDDNEDGGDEDKKDENQSDEHQSNNRDEDNVDESQTTDEDDGEKDDMSSVGSNNDNNNSSNSDTNNGNTDNNVYNDYESNGSDASGEINEEEVRLDEEKTGIKAQVNRHIPDFIAILVVVVGIVIYEVYKRLKNIKR